MKKLTILIILALSLLLIGCGSPKPEGFTYDEYVEDTIIFLYETDNTDDAVAFVIIDESGPVLEMAENQKDTSIVNVLLKKDTAIKDSTRLLELKDMKKEDMNRKELTEQNNLEYEMTSKRIDKQLDILNGQQQKLDSLLELKKK